MESSHITLGRALACLSEASNINAISLSSEQQDYVNRLRERTSELQMDGKFRQILSDLPEMICDSSNPFLLNNLDFFLAFFAKTKSEDICNQLYSHLNSCFSCYEIFAGVLQDFYGQSTGHRER